jgi:hypothetical protein
VKGQLIAIVSCVLFVAGGISGPVFAGPGARFRRGDSNGDGRHDLADGIRILNWLFAGNAEIPCLESADVNDDGKPDLSDPIALLGFLFLGTAPPPPPFPTCGEDPTPDDVPCGSNDDSCPQDEPDVPHRHEMSFRLRLPKLEVTSHGDSSARDILAPGFFPTGEEGDPRLLLRTYRVILPRDAVAEGLELEVVDSQSEVRSLPEALEPIGSFHRFDEEKGIQYIPRKDGAAIVGGRNVSIYENDAFYPASPVGRPTFQTYRGWRIASFPVHLAQYNPVTRSLRVHTTLDLKLSAKVVPGSNRTAQSVISSGLSHVKGSIVDDDVQGLAGVATEYDVSPTDPPSPTTILLVTADIIDDERFDNGLQAFVDHKESLGMGVKVVTVEDIDSQYATGDKPWKIREYIKDWNPHDTYSYIILVGNPDPYADDPAVPLPDPAVVPMLDTANGTTDLYYSDLDNDWDLDGNGHYARTWEETGYPDIPVGRIAPAGGYVDDVVRPGLILGTTTPLLTITRTEKLRRVFEKLIRYDKEIDKSWRYQILSIGSYMYGVNGGSTAQTLDATLETIEAVNASYHDFEVYQDGTAFGENDAWFDGAASPEADEALAGSSTLPGQSTAFTRWSDLQPGMVLWRGHGSYAGTQVGGGCDHREANCTFDGDFILRDWFLDPDSFSGAELTNDRPAVVFSASCNNFSTGSGSFSKDTPDYVLQRSKWGSLAQSMLLRGAVAFVGATNTTSGERPVPVDPRFGQSAWYQRDFMGELADGSTFGNAFFETKQWVQATYSGSTDHDTELEDWLRFNLCGDPSQKMFQSITAFPDDDFEATADNDDLAHATLLHFGEVLPVAGPDLTVTVDGGVSKDDDYYLLMSLGTMPIDITVELTRDKSLGDLTLDVLNGAGTPIAGTKVGNGSKITYTSASTSIQPVVYVKVGAGKYVTSYDLVIEIN